VTAHPPTHPLLPLTPPPPPLNLHPPRSEAQTPSDQASRSESGFSPKTFDKQTNRFSADELHLVFSRHAPPRNLFGVRITGEVRCCRCASWRTLIGWDRKGEGQGQGAGSGNASQWRGSSWKWTVLLSRFTITTMEEFRYGCGYFIFTYVLELFQRHEARGIREIRRRGTRFLSNWWSVFIS